jgi:SM-20-related protein
LRKQDMTEPKIRKALISGREIFICDNVIDPLMMKQIGAEVGSLPYTRTEKSRADVPGLVAVSDIAPEKVAANPFLRSLRRLVEKAFPHEQFSDQRAYVNCSIHGDGYYMHRDCPAQEANVTALYYANLEWHPDWGGETIFYTDEEEADMVVMPRPGRLVIARGAILHRGNVPTRICYQERYTLAYKLNSLGAAPSEP